MITEQELEELKTAVSDFNYLVRIQCTKPPNVVNTTAKLLGVVNETDCADILRGQ